MKKTIPLLIALALLAFGCSSSSTSSDTSTTSPTASTTGAASGDGFASVQTIFSSHCTGCHGENGKQGINLTSQESIMKGGNEGAIVTPGDPDKSKLIDALRGRNGAKQMPFNQAPLGEEDIKKIEAWIKAGAKA